MRIICIMMLYRLTRGRRREEEQEQEKKKQQRRHANCMRDNWVRSRDFWGRRFRNLVGEIAMLYAVSLCCETEMRRICAFGKAVLMETHTLSLLYRYHQWPQRLGIRKFSRPHGDVSSRYV